MSAPERLPSAVSFEGLHLQSLGHYLAALVLLRVASRPWPRVRGCWKEGVFVLVGGPASADELIGCMTGLQASGAQAQCQPLWSAYQRGWSEAQKSKDPDTLATWLGQCDEEMYALAVAHLVPARAKIAMNPLLGTGGNTGKRFFDEGRARAIEAIEKAGDVVLDLGRFLAGSSCRALGSWQAGSWFSQANKAYNSGTRHAARDGQVTPWAMALACEGIRFFSGAASKRLGSSVRRPAGAFPFITEGAAPLRSGENGKVIGEVWAPVWQRPMAAPEVSLLFARGRADSEGAARSRRPPSPQRSCGVAWTPA